MAAGPITFLTLDSSVEALNSWQLLKTPTTAQTAITGARLADSLRDVSFAEDNLEAIDVSMFNGIRYQVWGEGSNDHAPVITFYGWDEPGPGYFLCSATCTMGNYTVTASTNFLADAATHSSIRGAFTATTAYRGCDTYADAVDTLGIHTPSAATADVLNPGGIVDLSQVNPKWLLAVCADLGSATNAGVIFKPTQFKGGMARPGIG